LNLNNVDYSKYATPNTVAKLFGCGYKNIHYHIAQGNLKDVIRLGEEVSKPVVLVNIEEVKLLLEHQNDYHKRTRGGGKRAGTE
jgi:hypothetical protein